VTLYARYQESKSCGRLDHLRVLSHDIAALADVCLQIKQQWLLF